MIFREKSGVGLAVGMLVLATATWGLSFPLVKALGMLFAQNRPEAHAEFFAAWSLTVRYAGAALGLWIWRSHSLRHITRGELFQGTGLGLSTAAGMFLQTDGLHYIDASTSAFLTQFYCVLIPAYLAIRHRRWPSRGVLISCGLVALGMLVLARPDWQRLRLGRGELETLLCSAAFAVQILWLNRPRFHGNNMDRVTLVLFVVLALTCLPLALGTARQPADFTALFAGAGLALVLALTLVCSLFGILAMTHWQPRLDPTRAAIIYCAEPVFAALFALVLPAWFSRWLGVAYPNESLSGTLLLGGALIVSANLVIARSVRETD